MSQLYDVVIAGAGPIGLFLACELGLAGVSVLVLERDSSPESPWKSNPLGIRGLTTPSVEAFYRRGLLDKLYEVIEMAWDPEKKSGFKFGGHFAGIMLDGNKLELSRWKYTIPGPSFQGRPTTMERIETELAKRAESLGVKILRGNEVTRIVEQDEESVTVEVGGGDESFRGRWLVGCDGGRSAVRKAVGFDFVGTEARFTGYALECELDHPEKLLPGFHATETGGYITGPLKNSMYLIDFDDAKYDRTQEIKQAHLQEVLTRITGVPDVHIKTVNLASTFTDRSKQAATYRKGRVLLAGDAAHIHPPFGGQGLNAGIGDAVNLGWKLAATIRQESQSGRSAPLDLTLLDTYGSERRPAAARVIESTRAQVVAFQPDAYGKATRALIRDLANTVDGANLMMGRYFGISNRYTLAEDESTVHPAVGRSVPDFELADDSRLGPKMADGHGLFIDLGAGAAFEELVAKGKYAATVDYLKVAVKDARNLGALLVRPDGVVAWAVDENEKPDENALKAVLERWFEY